MKTALVTGVSRQSGIGFGICKSLLDLSESARYKVFAIYNTDNECETPLVKKYGERVKFIKCDFTNPEKVDKLINKLKIFDFDLIINNAGMFADGENYKNYNMKIWDDIISVNVRTPMAISTGLFNQLNQKAVIINVASTDGFRGSYSSMSYAASKAALINITQSLAINFGYDDKKIRVVGVAPSWVETDITMLTDAAKEFAPMMTPLGRMASVQEMVDLIVFLASDKATYITGTTITFDGGYSITDYTLMKEAEASRGK